MELVTVTGWNIDEAADALDKAADRIERLTQPAGDTEELIERAQRFFDDPIAVGGGRDLVGRLVSALIAAEARHVRDQEWIDRFQGLAAAKELERLGLLQSIAKSVQGCEDVLDGPDPTARVVELVAEWVTRAETSEARTNDDPLIKSLTEELSASEAERVALKEDSKRKDALIQQARDDAAKVRAEVDAFLNGPHYAAMVGASENLAAATSREEALREAAQKAIERMASMGAPPLVWRELANALAEPPSSPTKTGPNPNCPECAEERRARIQATVASAMASSERVTPDYETAREWPNCTHSSRREGEDA